MQNISRIETQSIVYILAIKTYNNIINYRFSFIPMQVSFNTQAGLVKFCKSLLTIVKWDIWNFAG